MNVNRVKCDMCGKEEPCGVGIMDSKPFLWVEVVTSRRQLDLCSWGCVKRQAEQELAKPPTTEPPVGGKAVAA